MSFDVSTALERSEQYSLYDRKHYGDRLEGVSPADYEKLKEIIKKWQKDLFNEELYPSPQSFSFRIGEEDSEAVNIFKNATALLHSLTHENVAGHCAPTEEKLNTIHEMFLLCANTFNENEYGEVNREFKQLALHPRLLEKCSEAFVKHVAAKANSQVYDYDYGRIIDQNRQLIAGDKEAFISALKRWKNDLFMELFCTLKGNEELEKEIKLPDYGTLSYQDAWIGTVKYMTRVAAMTGETASGESTTQKEKLIKEALEGCLERFKAFRASQELHIASKQAAEELKEINRSLETLDVKHKELIEAIESLHSEAKKELAEAQACTKECSSLKEGLTDETATRQSRLEDLENKIRITNATYEKLHAENQAKDEEAKSIIEKAKEAQFSDEINFQVPKSHIKDIETLINNVGVLTACYEAFWFYATGHAGRELPEPIKPGLWGRVTSWLSWQ
jgi:hypothetical protein